jgi:hypothetical protein
MNLLLTPRGYSTKRLSGHAAEWAGKNLVDSRIILSRMSKMLVSDCFTDSALRKSGICAANLILFLASSERASGILYLMFISLSLKSILSDTLKLSSEVEYGT